jgi:hypothetical protein
MRLLKKQKKHPKSLPSVGNLDSGVYGERPLHQQKRGPRYGNNRKWRAVMKWKNRKRNRQMIKDDDRKVGNTKKLGNTCGC